jgi:hypothetical protein
MQRVKVGIDFDEINKRTGVIARGSFQPIERLVLFASSRAGSPGI